MRDRIFVQHYILIYGPTYGIIQIENKTTAVQGSANSHAPAQVVLAPTQRDYPAPQGYYILFALVLQEEKYIVATASQQSYHDLHRVELSALHGVLFSLSPTKEETLWKTNDF